LRGDVKVCIPFLGKIASSLGHFANEDRSEAYSIAHPSLGVGEYVEWEINPSSSEKRHFTFNLFLYTII